MARGRNLDRTARNAVTGVDQRRIVADYAIELPLFSWPPQPVSRRACAPDPACLPRGPKTGRRRLPTWSAARPATPSARPGLTHRDERNVR
jgi:hypothetical protein